MPKTGLDGFFQAASEIKLQSLKEMVTSEWQRRIDPTHLYTIYQSISKEKNQIVIWERILFSLTGSARFHYSETGLYLTAEMIDETDITHLLLSTKSKIANHQDNKRIKLHKLTAPEAKAGRLNGRQLTDLEIKTGQIQIDKALTKDKSFTKKYQVCLHWQPGMPEPQPYAAGVISGKKAVLDAHREIKYSRMIGPLYAHTSLLGPSYLNKSGEETITLYSPIARYNSS